MTRSQPTYADLEIRILPRAGDHYPVEFTVDGRQFPPGHLDANALPGTAGFDEEAGERLWRWLLTDPRLKEAWDQTMGLDSHCRIRLRIDAEAPVLHTVPWELLRQPVGPGGTAHDLTASDKTPFSRYLALPRSPGSSIVDQRLRILVAIADPDDLPTRFDLMPIDRAAELTTLKAAVAELPVELTELPSPCTISAIEAALRRGYHVLHFVGHGAFVESEGAALYLANGANAVRLTLAAELTEMLARLAGPNNPLQLVFLGSCQTATTSPADAFRGLAPQLLQAGVPAVLAMQDLVAADTYRAFASTFYRQLMQHGVVDLAVNQARSALLTARLPGAAVPVLFMRVPDGKLLAIPEQAGAAPPLAARPTPPLSVTTLVGREHFLDQLAAELNQPSAGQPLALTALRGLPGVGKTALALELVNRADVAAAFPEGCAWLPLGPKPDLFGALARLLEQFGAFGQDLLTVEGRADRLRSLLAGRRYLLVLDDVWASEDGRLFVEACASPGRVLITTRFPQIASDLHAANHEVYTLKSDPAVEMLAGAGQHAAAAVAADREGAAALAGDLGGLPLALHVAGRRLERQARADGHTGALARLRGEIGRRLLRLPAAERRLGIEAAEPSLEAILALSYDALPDDAARRAFRRLAVFGSQPFDFDADAMATVWQVDEYRAADLRIALIDAGLLERALREEDADSRPSSDKAPRYALHQVIAAFAELRLSGDPAEARLAVLAHARHYSRVVAGYDEAIDAGRMTYSAPLDWENVALAVQRLTDGWKKDDEAADILLTYAANWRNIIYNNHDPRRAGWLEAAEGAARRRNEPWKLANVLKAQGDVLAFLDQREEALARYGEALTLYRAVGDRLGEANVLLALGDIYRARKEYDSAWQSYAEVHTLYTMIGDRYSLARVLYRMGDWHAEQQQAQPAAELYRQAIDLWRSIGVDELVESILLPRLQAVTS